MEELRNYPEPTGPQPPLIDAMQVSWWSGEIPDGNAQRPVSVEYKPVLYYPQGPTSYAWRAIAGQWVVHFPLQGPQYPWDHFVTYMDRELGFERQVTWRGPNGVQLYQILWIWDYDGTGIKVCPHPSQVNYVSFGDMIKVWGSGRVDLAQIGIAPDGPLWLLTLSQNIIASHDGAKYIRCKMPDGSYAGIPLAVLPPGV